MKVVDAFNPWFRKVYDWEFQNSRATAFPELLQRAQQLIAKNNKAFDAYRKGEDEYDVVTEQEFKDLWFEIELGHTKQVNQMSPVLDVQDMIKLMKENKRGGKRISESSITRFKKKWQAESVSGTNNQSFRFNLKTLKKLNVKYPSQWDTKQE